DIGGDELDETVGNFVALLATNKRLPLLPGVFRLFDALPRDYDRAADIELTSAMAVDSAAEEKLAKALAAKLARKGNLHTVREDSLIAGAIIKAGDLVIDGSMRGRLEKLAKAINS